MVKDWAKKVLVASAAVAPILGVHMALAQNFNAISLPNPLSLNSLQAVVDAVSKFLLLIAAPVLAVMVLIGGFQMMTAAGNPEKFLAGRKTLRYAVIGFAVVLLAGGVGQIIKSFLGTK